ncbi:MAG TPA: hypothetical protein VH643_10945 [Gemmataceae bacterium]|jgi:predicted lipid-binding transport protein (Tim44 family)
MKLLSLTGSATEARIRYETPADSEQPRPPSRDFAVIRLALGGAICGGFLGSFGGALVGILLGICKHDLSLGLDGALIGGLVLVVVGAVYGRFFV